MAAMQTMADGVLVDYDVTCLASEWWDIWSDSVDNGIDYCVGDGTIFGYQGYMLRMDNGMHKIFGSDGLVHDVPGDTVIYIKFDDLDMMKIRLANILSAVEKETTK